jgi:hypothetical protein
MNELSPDDKINLRFETVEDGLLFLFQRANRETDDTIRVRQSWSNIHSLLSRLRKNQTYCAKDVPLLIWQEGQELHIKFHDPGILVVDECVFSSQETKRILTGLEMLPNLN